MYRKTIEHPEYLPEEVRKHTDVESGKDMGRIWRIVRKDMAPAALATARTQNVKSVSAADIGGVVSPLRSSNGWTRDTAMRLITELGADTIAPQLETLASAGDAPPATVVCCLSLLANAGKLDDAVLTRAMKHAEPMVRETAVRLSEKRLSNSPSLADQVLTMTVDPHVHVRYAAVLAAGELRLDGSTGRVIEALAKPALTEDANDTWFRAAICSSLPSAGGNLNFLVKLSNGVGGKAAIRDGVLSLVHDVAGLVAADIKSGDVQPAFESLFAVVAPRGFPVRTAALAGFVRRGGPAAVEVLRQAIATDPKSRLAQTIAEAGGVAADAAAPVNRRISAAELLALAGDSKSADILLSLVVPEQPVELAIAAARGLVESDHGASGAAKLLDAKCWARYSPALRTTVLTLLTGRPEFAGPVLNAVESGALPAAALGEPQRTWLRKIEEPALRARAEKLLSAEAPEDRKKAYEDAKVALQLTPVPANGQRVFVNHCATCHRLDREGYAVGPDLYGIRNQPKESILLHIVIPEQEVAPNFAAYDCLTKDGRAISGIMAADTPASVTLRQAAGLEETIPRERIKRLTASKFSLMPPGLEQAMSRQELADLLAYLRGEK
jgi:putative heme-binding domain-containing protein